MQKPEIETIGLLSFEGFLEVETLGLLSNRAVTVVSMSDLRIRIMAPHQMHYACDEELFIKNA